MKKHLLISNNFGMAFPLILFILPILLITLYTSIDLYAYDIQFAMNHEEQLKIESLTQAGITKYKNDLNMENPYLPKNFTFPHGSIKISPISQLIDNTQTVKIIITTDNNYNYQANITIKLTNN